LLLSAPYYQSFGALQDPTHYGCPNEATFTYFDPLVVNNKPGIPVSQILTDSILYNIYVPKPWRLCRNSYQFTGNMEVILEPEKLRNGKVRPLDKIKERRLEILRKKNLCS